MEKNIGASEPPSGGRFYFIHIFTIFIYCFDKYDYYYIIAFSFSSVCNILEKKQKRKNKNKKQKRKQKNKKPKKKNQKHQEQHTKNEKISEPFTRRRK